MHSEKHSSNQVWSYLNVAQLLPVGLCQDFTLLLHPRNHQVYHLPVLLQGLHIPVALCLEVLFSTTWKAIKVMNNSLRRQMP